MADYKEIKIGAPAEDQSIEVTLEEAVPAIKDGGLEFGEDDPVEPVPAPIVEEEPKAKEADDDEGEEDPKPKKTPKKGSSSQRRIRELNSRAKEAEERATAAEKALEEAKAKYTEGAQESKITLKDALESKITSLTSTLMTAMEEGDSAKTIAAQDDLMNVKMELMGLKYEIKQNESVKVEKPAEPVQPQAPQLPEKVTEWIDEHPSFNTNELFRVNAIALNNQLLSEGYSVDTDDFYTELNTRLGKFFPKEFGIDDKNVVESTKDSSDADNKDVKRKSSTKARVTDQVVSGSSRPSSTNITTPTKRNTVKLSPEEIEYAENSGISLENLAKRKAHIEKYKNDGSGYTPIKIG